MQRVKEAIEFMSVGKYQTKLYHKGSGQYSTVLGGLMTIAIGIMLIAFSITTLSNLKYNPSYTVKDDAIDLEG